MAAPNNDDFANAWDITIAGPGYQYLSGPVSNAYYTQAGTFEPSPDMGLTWTRTAWWKYSPTASGTWTIALGGTGLYPFMNVYRLDGTDLTYLNHLEGTDFKNIAVTAGEVFYCRVGTASPDVGTYVVNSSGPVTGGPPAHDSRSSAAVVALLDSNPYEAAPTPLDLLTKNLNGTDDATTAAADAPAGYNQSAWWVYTPLTSGTLEVAFAVSVQTDPAVATLVGYHDVSGTLTYVTRAANRSTLSMAVTAGETYYLAAVVSTDGSAFQSYRLTATGPASIGAPVDPNLDAPAVTLSVDQVGITQQSPNLYVPVISTTVAVRGRITGEIDTVILPPLTLSAALSAVESVAAPAITAGVTAVPGSVVGVYAELTAPDDAEIVPTARPDFVIGLTQEDDDLSYTVEVQWASDTAFTTDVHTQSALADPTDGGVTITPTVDLPSPAYWRARVLLGADVILGYTAYRAVFTDPTAGSATLPITWSVGAGDRAIHLWHVEPPGGEPGDQATAYGQGFPLTAGHISIAGIDAPVDSWTLVPATSATTDRVISADVVDAEHFEVVFTVPDVPEPGGPLLVEA